jgi:phosphopantetheine--protein transferase-like protein
MIGIDLVYIPEFKAQIEIGGKSFLYKAFSTSELKNKKPEHLAGLWAVKEAVIKASNVAPDKYTDIVISYDISGKPRAHIGETEFTVSIAHHGDYAVAVAHRV